MTTEKLYQQTHLTTEMPYAAFLEMYHKEVLLFPSVGYRPLLLTVKLLRKSLSAGGRLLLERAEIPANFTYGVKAYEVEGVGGRILKADSVKLGNLGRVIGGLPWQSAGLTIVADATLVSGSVITIPSVDVEAFLAIRSTAGMLKHNLFRVRRKFDTAITAEVVGAADSSTTNFAISLAKKNICPSSIKVNFTDVGGAKVALIRDNGRGEFTTLPPEILLAKVSSINYETGAIDLTFADDHVPTAGNVTIDYEYSSVDAPDTATYDVTWEHGNG